MITGRAGVSMNRWIYRVTGTMTLQLFVGWTLSVPGFMSFRAIPGKGPQLDTLPVASNPKRFLLFIFLFFRSTHHFEGTGLLSRQMF
jgi:hypothetical protein